MSDLPEPALPEIPLRPLSTQLLRDLLWAPELERYLGVRHLDFSLLDQKEAVKVRLVTGLDVLNRRILASLVAGLRRQVWVCALMGITAGAATSAVVAASMYYPPLCITVAVVMGIAAFVATRRWISLRGDMKLLQLLHQRYAKPVQACEEMKPLLAIARAIESEVRTLAAREPDEGAQAAEDP